MTENNSISLLLASNNDNLAEEIRRTGVNLVQTRDGFETIKAALESKPDAVLLDTLTEGLPSPTVAIWLKLNANTNKVPIIGLSTPSAGWQEARVDAELDPSNAVSGLSDLVAELAETLDTELGESEFPEPGYNPLDITLDLIEVYRERLLLASAMIELASLQHDLGDFEYTIKSILETAGKALGSELINIALINESIHYTLVRGSKFSRKHLDELETYSLRELSDLLDKPTVIDNQLVIGRRKLTKLSDDDTEVKFIGHPIRSRGETLGYLSCVAPDNPTSHAYYHGLLPDLTSQIALLLVNADLITTQENYVSELSSILRAVVETSSISSISEETSKSFLLQFLLVVLEICHTDRGCIILFDEDTEEVSESASLGIEVDEVLESRIKNKKILGEELLNFPAGEVYTDTVWIDHQKYTRLIVPLSADEQNVGGLVVFGKSPNITASVEEAIKALASLAGYHANNRNLHHKIIEKSIIEDQLNTAREVQLEMLPDKSPDFPGFDIAGISTPAKEVGGDFFDYFPGDQCLNIAIGDVCGKSIPASLLMTMSRALFLAAIESSHGPNEVLQKVNSLLTRTITQGKFVTGSLLSLNGNGISYSSAGHQPLLVYRAGIGEFQEIDAEGIALGIIKDMEFELVNFELDSNDIALMYTDGLNEAMNPEREQFGYEKIRNVIRENADNSAIEIIDALTSALKEHVRGADQHDDTTIIVVKKN